MKLTEILRVFQRAGLNPKAIKHDTAAIIGNYEGNAIWNIKTTNPDEEIFAIKKDNQIVSQIFGRFWVLSSQRYFILADTHTLPEYQRQGLATSLYMFLVRGGTKILSDKQQTQRGEDLWNSIRRQHPERVKVLDTKELKIYDVGEIPNAKLYIDGSKETPQTERYRLVLEQLPGTLIPEVGVGILNERIIYTNPDNCGEFV